MSLTAATAKVMNKDKGKRRSLGWQRLCGVTERFDWEKIQLTPCYFVETGLPLLINQFRQTCRGTLDSLQINVYGGADSIRSDDRFKIGQKNIQATVEVLKSFGLRYNLRETGGTISRTLKMSVATGVVTITKQPLQI